MKTLKTLLTLTLTTTMLTTVAQDSQPTNKNTIFFEAGGNSFFYSINYDHILTDKETWKFAGRAGIMYLNYFRNDKRQMIGTPLEFSYLRGTNNNYLELGFGVTPIYDTYEPSELSTVKDLVVLSVVRLGYRHQKPEGGLFFKAGITPLRGLLFDLNQNPINLLQPNHSETFVYPFAGIALGWTFRKK